MKTAVIVDSVRTGLAKSHRGGFNITRADDMLAHIINNLMEEIQIYQVKRLKTSLWVVVIQRAQWVTI